MAKKQNFAPPMVGGSSLLVIFGILSLTIFALLSLSTVQAHTRLSDRSVQSVSDYYAADCAAEQILAKMRAGETPKGVAHNGNDYSYEVRISDTQKLVVEVRLGGEDYKTLRWQAVTDADWQADDTLAVWDGQMLEIEEQTN